LRLYYNISNQIYFNAMVPFCNLPMVNEGLMDYDAEISTKPVLQLFDEQHDVACPNVDEPILNGNGAFGA
jgi:hypothetical protein